MKLFKIKGRDMRAHQPWLGAKNKKKALQRCKELNIIDIESIEDDTKTSPWAQEE